MLANFPSRYSYQASTVHGINLVALGNARLMLYSPVLFAIRVCTATAEHTQDPRKVTVDRNAAYPVVAVERLKNAETLSQATKLRRKKYLNNVMEQDHRGIKELVKPGKGFKSFNTARRTLKGYEMMNMIRKGQVKGIAKGNSVAQAKFIAKIFGVAA